MSNTIIKITPKDLTAKAEGLSTDLESFLVHHGLPTCSVLVSATQRRQVINNLEAAIDPLDPAHRPRALYLSKFVAATAAGLFDAALNYLWDETIRNLREKVARFDLAYFFDTIQTDPSVRARFKEASDLERLDDWQLVKGCRETGIITDIGYKHLDYIRDMRNHASAAHPNHNELTGLQLASWLETCIKEVLGVEPAGPVVEVRRLLNNLRQESLTPVDVPPIEAALDQLPQDLASSLMRSISGMFCDPGLSATARANIVLIAPAAWAITTEEARFEVGMKFGTLSANGESSRAKLAREFLDVVDGAAYLPADTLAVEINAAIEALATAHRSINNFYLEPAPAKTLRSLLPANGAVPKSVLMNFVRTVTMCAIGNGYGVSWGADSTYDEMIAMWSNDAARCFVKLLTDLQVVSRLGLGQCGLRFQNIAIGLESRVTSPNLKAILKEIAAAEAGQIYKLPLKPAFLANLNAIRPLSAAHGV